MSNAPIRPLPLTILGASEDVPRMITAFGRAWGGDTVLILRPRDNTGLLLHEAKKQAATVWRTDLGLAPSHAPELVVTPEDAVAEMKRTKANPPPAGPATLKGTWSGHLYVDGAPVVKLARKVATYGTLQLTSTADGRWTAVFERAEKWFSKAKQDSVTRSGLAEAIAAGMGLVVGLVSEACSFRDTHRRNTVDPEYAVRYPVPPEREKKDRTERFAPKGIFKAVELENGWAVVNAVGATVALFGKREKGRAQKHATALTKGAVAPSPTPTATVSPEIASGFGLSDMPGVRIPTLDEIPSPKVPSGAVSTANIAEGVVAEARAIEVMADSLWGSSEAPELLGRAARLIKHAEALVRSPLCIGKEKHMALEDVRRAGDAYAQAHAALERGEKPDIVQTLRRIAERVSLAAARAGKSCASGQQKLGPAARSPDDIATGIGRRESGWTWGDRVTWHKQVWRVQDVRADGSVDIRREGTDLAETVAASDLRRAPATQPETVSMQPAWPPAAPPQRVRTTRTAKAPAAPTVDAAKDKVLVDAFAQAIATAAASMRQGTTRETLPAACRFRALTATELGAVESYAKEHGRSWKEALRDDWSNARTRGPLQQLRNELGPLWLDAFRLSKRESCPSAARTTRETCPSR